MENDILVLVCKWLKGDRLQGYLLTVKDEVLIFFVEKLNRCTTNDVNQLKLDRFL